MQAYKTIPLCLWSKGSASDSSWLRTQGLNEISRTHRCFGRVCRATVPTVTQWLLSHASPQPYGCGCWPTLGVKRWEGQSCQNFCGSPLDSVNTVGRESRIVHLPFADAKRSESACAQSQWASFSIESAGHWPLARRLHPTLSGTMRKLSYPSAMSFVREKRWESADNPNASTSLNRKRWPLATTCSKIRLNVSLTSWRHVESEAHCWHMVRHEVAQFYPDRRLYSKYQRFNKSQFCTHQNSLYADSNIK